MLPRSGGDNTKKLLEVPSFTWKKAAAALWLAWQRADAMPPNFKTDEQPGNILDARKSMGTAGAKRHSMDTENAGCPQH